jgi:hypothetical protein
MKGYTTGEAHRRSGVFPYIEIWKQPTRYWVIANLYHSWEWLTDPVMSRISDWHEKRFKKSEDYAPLNRRRDIKCYRLYNKGRKVLAIVNITEEQYFAINGKSTIDEKLRYEAKEPILDTDMVEVTERHLEAT